MDDELEQKDIKEELKALMGGVEGEDDIGALVRGGSTDKQGVLHRIITAALEDNMYRQQLLMAAFEDDKQASYCAAAINQCRRYGIPVDIIINHVIAQCAVKAGRVEGVLRGVTHQYFMTNYRGNGNMPEKKGRNSPL